MLFHQLEEILQQIKEEKTEESQEAGGSMVLDATAEFCRTLGDIPTYGLAGNREHTAEIMVWVIGYLDIMTDLQFELEN